MEKLCSTSLGGVTGNAIGAGFDGVFTGSKPCKTEKIIRPGADLCFVVRKLIRSIMIVTQAWRNVDISKPHHMSTERSDGVHEKWRASAEKFDYFILGVLGALCAYISQNYKPEKLAINPGTVELLALLILVLAAIIGFRRIEATNLATLINHQILHAHERRGVLTSVIHNGPRFNSQTGQTYTQEYAQQEIPELGKKIDQLTLQLHKVQQQAQRHYQVRNVLMLLGFLVLLATKVFSAYV